MKKTNRLRALLCAFPLILTSHAAETATFSDAFTQGKISINARARFEGVQQTGLLDAEALTLRTRLGFTTAPLHGFKAMAELENIVSPDGDRYSQAGINSGGAGRAVVADPEGTELNQAFLAYATKETTVTVGRQRVVLDNTRFVGDVAWRQNMQTFDGVTIVNKSVENLTLNYGYLTRINRVFGNKHPQGNWDSDSHLFNASYAGLKAGTITGYAYLLDFDNAAAQSSATYGVSFAGATPITDAVKLTYRAEFATQCDYKSSALHYTAEFLNLEAGAATKMFGLALGYEELGSDNGVSFRTPLATLHAFNGWADMFLVTPANGLRDVYLKGTLVLPHGFNFLGFYHEFKADRLGADFGSEVDLQLTRKFGKQFTGLIKFAKFESDSASFADVTKFWAQVEYAY
ncbi:MAG TPA: alginate export family protein [Opitutaceae bacterium]|nr:alginate export family protein [Opitutaceae bacterium]